MNVYCDNRIPSDMCLKFDNGDIMVGMDTHFRVTAYFFGVMHAADERAGMIEHQINLFIENRMAELIENSQYQNRIPTID